MKTGFEQLLDKHKDWLAGKRVALLGHQAAVDAQGRGSAERLRTALGDGLVALMGPEHGYDGCAVAGEKVQGGTHGAWGIPVWSLYGEHRAPTAEMLNGVDVLVCDLQDLGARCYTYLATMQLAMEACAKHGVEFIVCDRPVPLPCVVDGPVVKPGFESFVAPAGFAMCTGMTPGEAAAWLAKKRDGVCVAWMEDLPRDAERGAGWPEFVAPSPSLRTWESCETYLATVFSEALPAVDIGRGTNVGFRVVGAPWEEGRALAAKLENENLEGVRFHPYSWVAAEGAHKGKVLEGVRLRVTDAKMFKPVWTSLVMLDVLGSRVWQGEGTRHEWFDALYGGGEIRATLMSGAAREELKKLCCAGHEEYLATRAEAIHY